MISKPIKSGTLIAFLNQIMKKNPQIFLFLFNSIFGFLSKLHLGLWIGLFSIIPLKSQAVIRTDNTVRQNAFFVRDESEVEELFQSLDLIKRKYVFTPSDIIMCRKALVRLDESLSYSCTVGLPGYKVSTRLHEQVSPQTVYVRTSQQNKEKREVEIEVSEDARFVTFSVDFDDSGVDFDLAEFNDHFFNVYDQVALTVINEAMRRDALVVKVLEHTPIPVITSPPSLLVSSSKSKKIKKNKMNHTSFSYKSRKR